MQSQRDNHFFSALPEDIFHLISNTLSTPDVLTLVTLDAALYQYYRLEVMRSYLYNHAITRLSLPPLVNTYFFTRGGYVFVCGENIENTLGLNLSGKITSPSLLKPLKQVVDFKTLDDSKNTFYRLLDGSVYVTGRNRFGQLGIGNSEPCHTPLKITIESLPPIKKIRVFTPFSFFLSETGQIYFCGDNTSFITHLEQALILTPQLIDLPCTFTDIELYGRNLFMLDASGKVFALGENNDGFFGFGDSNPRYLAVQITALQEHVIRKISLCHYSSFFLTQVGLVFACGNNEVGQLGCGDELRFTTPQLIIGLPRIKQVISGHMGTFFLCENGDVYACGTNITGELGITCAKSTYPKKLPLTNIVQIKTDKHTSFFIDNEGDVFGCGLNESGELGVGDTFMRTSPVRIKSVRKIIKTASLYGSTFFLTRNGKVFVAGKNPDGELGLGHKEACLEAQLNPFLKDIIDLEIDRRSASFLRKDGLVEVAGFNLAGELGLPLINDRALTPTLLVFNEIIERIKQWSLFDILKLAELCHDCFQKNLLDRAYELLADLTAYESISAVLPYLNNVFWRNQPAIHLILPGYSALLKLSDTSLHNIYAKLISLYRDESNQQHYIAFLKYVASMPSCAGRGQSDRFFNKMPIPAEIKPLLDAVESVPKTKLISVAKLLLDHTELQGGLKRERDKTGDEESSAKRSRGLPLT